MAKIKLTKGGVTIYVDPGAVVSHKGLGWRTGPAADLSTGGLSLDGVEVTAPAARLNELNLAYVATGLLENLFLRHYQITPSALSPTAVMVATNLAATTQGILSGITNPNFPRTVTIKGIAGMTGNVVITGSNVNGDAISDTIALSGVTEVEGIKAFATVTLVSLPVQTHTPTAQVETATVIGTITGSGNATVVVTAAGMNNTPKTISVAVLNTDSATIVAGKIITVLAADADVSAMFNVGGTGATVTLTRKVPAANDATLNVSTANGTCTGLTSAPTSADTTAGVAYDTCSVGQGKKFGMPQIVYNAACLLLALFYGTTDSGGTLTVDAALEKNLYSCAGTPNGSKLLDLYYLA